MADPADDLKEQISESVEKTGTTSVAEGERAGGVAQRTADVDPVLTNQLNQEPWWQSGIMWWGTGGVMWALGVIAVQVGTHGTRFQSYDYGTVVAAVGALASAAGVLYRRFAPGLRPYFWRWTS